MRPDEKRKCFRCGQPLYIGNISVIRSRSVIAEMLPDHPERKAIRVHRVCPSPESTGPGAPTPDTAQDDSGGKTKNPQYRGLHPNMSGRPPREMCITDKVREELRKKKKFRRPDGSIMESSELDLIAQKIVRQLRQGTGEFGEISPKLLDIVLDRIEGKPKEQIQLDGRLEVASGIDAKAALLQRLSKITTEKAEEDNRKS